MAFHLTIVTPQGPRYDGPVENVVLPGTEGDFGVLENHERLLAPLRIGEVSIRTPSEVLYAAIADGFAQVNGESVVVMVESCEAASDVDVARAQHALDRAQQGLATLGEDESTARFREFEAAIARAKNRLAVASHAQG